VEAEWAEGNNDWTRQYIWSPLALASFGISAQSPGTDFDVYLHTETPLNIPQQGFGAKVTSSGAGGDVTDFIMRERRHGRPSPALAGPAPLRRERKRAKMRDHPDRPAEER
jgi:hypothetical protein